MRWSRDYQYRGPGKKGGMRYVRQTLDLKNTKTQEVGASKDASEISLGTKKNGEKA